MKKRNLKGRSKYRKKSDLIEFIKQYDERKKQPSHEEIWERLIKSHGPMTTKPPIPIPHIDSKYQSRILRFESHLRKNPRDLIARSNLTKLKALNKAPTFRPLQPPQPHCQPQPPLLPRVKNKPKPKPKNDVRKTLECQRKEISKLGSKIKFRGGCPKLVWGNL